MKEEKLIKKSVSKTFQSKGGIALTDNRPKKIVQKDIINSIKERENALALIIKGNYNKPIQCVHEDKNWTFTTNEMYKIKKSSTKELYVHTDAEAPVPDNFFNKQTTDERNYSKYTSKIKLREGNGRNVSPEDCMEYALKLMFKDDTNEDHKKNLAYKMKNGNTRNVESDDERGLSLHHNELYNEDDNEDDTNPEEPQKANVGECMFIAPSPSLENDPNCCNYHGATVIAKDGGDQITSEVFAEQNEQTPDFKIYGNNEEGSDDLRYNFEKIYEGTFGEYRKLGDEPSRGILVPRNSRS